MHHFRNTYPTNTNAVSGCLIPDDEDNNTLPLAEINIAALQLTAPTNLSTVSIPYSYRYGFNGKENDKAVGFQDYGMRMYSPALARFISPDPLIVKGQQYPELSSYQFASNMPIAAIDLDGLEAKVVITRITYGSTNFNGTRTVNYEFIEANRETNREVFDSYSNLGSYGKRGTLAVFEQEGKETLYAFSISNWDAAKNWFDKNIPQVLVYGKGDLSTSLGEKADPNRKLISVDFNELSDFLSTLKSQAELDINDLSSVAPSALELLKDITDAIYESKQQEKKAQENVNDDKPVDTLCNNCHQPARDGEHFQGLGRYTINSKGDSLKPIIEKK